MKIDNTTKQILRDPKNRRDWIIYQVRLQGRSLAQVASDAGVSRQCLYQVFNRPYPRMEKVLSDALGIEPKVLWPERYHATGLPVRGTGLRRSTTDCQGNKDTPSADDRNVKKVRVG